MSKLAKVPSERICDHELSRHLVVRRKATENIHIFLRYRDRSAIVHPVYCIIQISGLGLDFVNEMDLAYQNSWVIRHTLFAAAE
jgi:hypothetical protein